MIAVELSASTMPIASAVCHGRPSSKPIAAIASVVSMTCPPPSPTSLPRMSHSRFGSSSSPTRNSIITTPNSANTCSASTLTLSVASTGLIAMPASK